MINNFWILVAQLSSVLVYVGVAFGLYRLLAAQKDAVIQAKDATIEHLQIHIQAMKSKVPDILVKQLEERLEIARKEIERLKNDKDTSSGEVQTLKDRQEVTGEILENLIGIIKVFQFLSEQENENYKDFVVDVCGNIDKAVKIILVSEDLNDLASKQGKSMAETDDVGRILVDAKAKDSMIVGRISRLISYVILKDNKIWIEGHSIQELTRKHHEITQKLRTRNIHQ